MFIVYADFKDGNQAVYLVRAPNEFAAENKAAATIYPLPKGTVWASVAVDPGQDVRCLVEYSEDDEDQAAKES